MGIFSNFFKTQKPLMRDVFEKGVIDIIKAAAIEKNDANKLKVAAYLVIVQMGLLSAMLKGKADPFIEDMINDVCDSVSDLKMRIQEIGNDENELKTIINFFPKEAEIDVNTTINGRAAFEAIYESFSHELVLNIFNYKGGDEFLFPYASIVLLEGVRGKGNGKDGMLDVSLMLPEFMRQVISAFH